MSSDLCLQQRSWQVKDFKADMAGRTISGYAATWDLDQYQDAITPGAFARTIQDRGPRMRPDGRVSCKIKLGYNHGPIVGVPTVLREDSMGLYFEAKVDATPLGDEVLTRIASGSLDSCSFAFDVIDSEWRQDGVRLLKELRLYELGPVDYPANEAAILLGIKSQLATQLGEIKAGRVLSAANQQLLQDAISALTALLDSSGGSPEPAPHVEENSAPLEPEHKTTEDEAAYIAAVNKFLEDHVKPCLTKSSN